MTRGREACVEFLMHLEERLRFGMAPHFTLDNHYLAAK